MGNQENFCVGSQVIGRLLEAQEQERASIAQVLHDEIGPSLAILGIDLLKTVRPASGFHEEEHPDIQELYRKVQEIGLRISRLSHQLHPSMLRYFGLAGAVQAECREFSESSRIPVSCSCKNVPRLDPAMELSFFRVVQEALRNAGRHSHATSVSVELTATADELIFLVSDNGEGFDAKHADPAAGLGLIRMREWMRRIGGEFAIRSQAARGTKISCRAPLLPPMSGKSSRG
ncbi:MAG: hypothetical protein HXY24_12565 [Rubrivivax sp.]|nr:hypothetical protein [Rubrivivax sp.]